MEERRQKILSYLRTHTRASVEELHSLFPHTSAMTIRRDLDFLERCGTVIRVYGGAMRNPNEPTEEARYGDREKRSRDAKAAIAARAVSLLGEIRSLYIDAGTTCMEFARRLPPGEYNIITPGANIAAELCMKSPRFNVTLLGGILQAKSLATSGSETLEQLSRMNIDTAVMCASGYSARAGFTNGHIGEAELKRAVIAKARRVILLMDAEKFGSTLTYTCAMPEDVDLLVCDRDPREAAENFDRAKIVIAQNLE